MKAAAALLPFESSVKTEDGRGIDGGREFDVTTFCYRGSVECLHSVRADAGAWLADRGVVGSASFDCLLVLNELSTNAVQASPDELFLVNLTLAPQNGRNQVVFAVTNRLKSSTEPPPSTDDWVFPEQTALKGRGLAIVSQVSDTTAVELSDDTVTVTASLTVDSVF
jgi:anti-sigma regulatory factor (Ser/Thr protein kinase)